MQPQPYPYAPPQAAAYPAPMATAAPRVGGVAGMLNVLMGARAGWPLLTFVLWRVVAPRDLESNQLMSNILLGVESLLSLVAVITFFVWLHRVTAGLRARGEQTKYSPGMAVGGWFIPFANLVMPYGSLADVWRRVMRTSAAPVVLWWLCYLGAILFDTFYRAVLPNILNRGSVSYEAVQPLLSALGYLSMLVEIGAWGLWLFIVRSVTQRHEPA